MYKSITAKNLFLIDALGALTSALILGVVLVYFKNEIGIHQNTLYFLAIFPVIFFCYSLSCALLIKSNWKPFLKAISIANVSYCLLSLGVICYYSNELTTIGFGYFILEILIVFIIARFEWKMALISDNNNF